jgi:molecular chaperone Hsp33
MSDFDDILGSERPEVPNLVVPRAIVPFHLTRAPVRGRLVRLGPLAEALLSRHPYPLSLRLLLGEALALTAGLASSLKFRGSFSLQIQGNGPVRLLLADATESGELRGTARFDETGLAALPPMPTARALLGEGYLAFTVDQGLERDRYQGIVALEGETLAAMAEAYFRVSEQIPTRIHLASGLVGGEHRASALILQYIPDPSPNAASETAEGETEEDEAADDGALGRARFEDAALLAATLRSAELLDDTLPPETLIARLFALEGVAIGQAHAAAFGCRCSRSRLRNILESFSPEDLDAMTVEGAVVMSCEFCHVDFIFPRAELRGREP